MLSVSPSVCQPHFLKISHAEVGITDTLLCCILFPFYSITKFNPEDARLEGLCFLIAMVQPQPSVSELKTTSITPSHKTASAVHFLQSYIDILLDLVRYQRKIRSNPLNTEINYKIFFIAIAQIPIAIESQLKSENAIAQNMENYKSME